MDEFSFKKLRDLSIAIDSCLKTKRLLGLFVPINFKVGKYKEIEKAIYSIEKALSQLESETHYLENTIIKELNHEN